MFVLFYLPLLTAAFLVDITVDQPIRRAINAVRRHFR